MTDNYYMNIEFEFDTRCKGLSGKFVGRLTNSHRYSFNDDKITEIISNIKKYIKEDNAMITLHIDNYDWYGSPHAVYRIIREWNGELSLVDFTQKEIGKQPFKSRDIKKLVLSYLEILDDEVNSNIQNSNFMC